MKKDDCKEIIQKRFRIAFKCIVLYKNPLPYRMTLEKNEIENTGIVWGLKRNIDKKCNNTIKIAKVYFALAPCMILLLLSHHIEHSILFIASMCNATVCIAVLTTIIYYYSIIKGVKVSSLA
jgi:hypothetical protein